MPDIVQGEFSTDVTAPVISNVVPADTSVDVLPGAAIEFDLTDEETGVDTASVVVTVGGVTAYDGAAGGFQTGYSGTFAQSGTTWHMSLTADAGFGSYNTITATVDAQDLALLPNVMPQYSWSFTTEDSETPYVSAHAPIGAGVAVDSAVTFTIQDDGKGVDLAQTVVTIGGVEAYNGGFSAGFHGSVTGGPGSYDFTVYPDTPYNEWQTYEVIVTSADLA